MLPIRAILFDADGVIQHTSPEGVSAHLARVMGSLPHDVDAFMHEVFAAEKLALVGRADFADILAPVLERWGAKGVARELAAGWWCSIDVDASLLALVARLRQRGLVCALATNQHQYRATYMQSVLAYGAVFERSFYSCQLGAMKPDREYFAAVLAALALAPEEVLFIDDAEKNVAGARQAGLHASRFVHPRDETALSSMIELLAQFSIAPGGALR